jgi:hypothetical protein
MPGISGPTFLGIIIKNGFALVTEEVMMRMGDRGNKQVWLLAGLVLMAMECRVCLGRIRYKFGMKLLPVSFLPEGNAMGKFGGCLELLIVCLTYRSVLLIYFRAIRT